MELRSPFGTLMSTRSSAMANRMEFFFFQAEDGIRAGHVTGVQTCALPILSGDESTVEYQDGLWIRKISADHVRAASIDRRVELEVFEIRSGAGKTNLNWARAAYMEVQRVREDRWVDLVVAPVWDQEGLYCVFDPT